MSENMVVLYHAHCQDGFVAAWSVWTMGFNHKATYVPQSYGDVPPDVTGKDVVIVDFSYPRAVLEEMNRVAKSLLVLDHHKTAAADLEGLPYATFDMNRSGAGLAWDTFHHGGKRSWIVDYTEDRDLWRWALPDSREVNAYLASVPHSFDRLLNLSQQPVESAIEKGQAILDYVEGRIILACESAYLGRLGWAGWDEYAPAIIVNTTHATSELLNELLQDKAGHRRVAYAVGWFERADGTIQYSLRSMGDFDVSAVAKLFGGGGHRNAAGFTSPVRVDVRVSGTVIT